MILLARRAAASQPAEALRTWLSPASRTTPPIAGVSTGWPEAPHPSAVAATPDSLLESPPAAGADFAAHAGSAVMIGTSPGEPSTGATPDALEESGDTLRTPEPALANPTDDTPKNRAEGPGSSEPPVTPPTPTPAPSAESAARDTASSSSPPVSSPAPARPRPKKAPAAYLSIGFQHRLKGGTLEVWVDATQVAKERLDSRVTKKALLFEVRTGSVQQTLRLEPGRHAVKVRVRSNGETRSARTTALFRAGATRRLEISLSRLSGKVSLEWR